MTVNLDKGENINLSKAAPSMKKFTVGLGWKPRGTDFDLDASIFLLNEQGKVRSDADFVFYGNLTQAPEAAVKHSGDNRTGEGDGDDEKVTVELDKLPADVQEVLFLVTIHKAAEKNQNFGQVGDAYIRIVDDATNNEEARFDLAEDASGSTSLVFGKLYRKDGDWRFKAVGEGAKKDLGTYARDLGVAVS